jgi:cytoskeleton protein RodZ
MRVLKTPEPDEIDEAAPRRDVERLGDVLREHREALGHSIADVAAYIRIRPVYLEAIEQGRYADLPGRTYAIGFVRGYAEFVGLDGEEAVRRFRAEAAGMDTSTQLVFPSPPPEGKVPGGAIMFVAVLLVTVVYGAWYYLSAQDQKLTDLVPALPERFAALLGGSPGASEGAARSDAAPTAPAQTTAPQPVAPSTPAPIAATSGPPGGTPVARTEPPARPEPARTEAARTETARVEPPRAEPRPAAPAPLQATSTVVISPTAPASAPVEIGRAHV